MFFRRCYFNWLGYKLVHFFNVLSLFLHIHLQLNYSNMLKEIFVINVLWIVKKVHAIHYLLTTMLIGRSINRFMHHFFVIIDWYYFNLEIAQYYNRKFYRLIIICLKQDNDIIYNETKRIHDGSLSDKVYAAKHLYLESRP